MKELIGVVAAVLVFVAYIPYFRDILKGRTKPHPYSWFIWGFNTSLILALQVTHGAGAGAYTTVTAAIISFIVCIFGLSMNGLRNIKPIDTVFLVMALIAMGVWLLGQQPVLSMILLVLIDVLGVAPSIRKAWNRPYEETFSMWALNGFRHALSVAAVLEFSLLTLLNPVTWAVCSTAFAIMLLVRRRSLGARRAASKSRLVGPVRVLKLHG